MMHVEGVIIRNRILKVGFSLPSEGKTLIEESPDRWYS
jgi:hypothetical protein